MTETEKRENLRKDLESLRIDRGEGFKRSPRPHRWRWIAVALVGFAGAAALMRAVNHRPVRVTVAKAEPSAPGENTVIPVLSGSGYVVTGDRYISVGVRVAGRIDRYFVEEGQTVKEGDPLVQLDDRDYRAAVDRTSASLEVARANRDLAEAELERGRQLRRQNVISPQEIDVLVNKAEVSRATVSQIEAELKQAKVSLDYTMLRAPSDGVILAKLKEVGEIAVPGGFSGSGDLIRLANLSDMRAEVDVNEADLNRVSMGQPAEVTPDAYPDAAYRAEVIKLYPQVDRQKGTLKVEVHILEPDDKLLPDMSARVTFLRPLPPEEANRPAVLVPGAALRHDAQGSYVWVVRDGQVHRAAVDKGADLADRTRIASGLQGGEAVVVSDAAGLSEGAPVEVAE